MDGSVSMPYRLLSPSRRWSPARTGKSNHKVVPTIQLFIADLTELGHDEKDGAIDVDPEVVRKGVRSLMQQVAQIERERVSKPNSNNSC